MRKDLPRNVNSRRLSVFPVPLICFAGYGAFVPISKFPTTGSGSEWLAWTLQLAAYFAASSGDRMWGLKPERMALTHRRW